MPDTLINVAQAAADALDTFVAALRRLNAASVTAPGAATPAGMGSSMDVDRIRAEFRMRLQDPQEIAALKKRLGL
jgi:hypothetical protein